ncbi:hypothetical protein C0J56_24225 [Pseudomonas fluorescens]|nr:hypothetical protein C0J56_24225 [Pseudomonas fluorescens]
MERACSRKGHDIQHSCKLTHRLREQARSHRSSSNKSDGCTPPARARSAVKPPRGGRRFWRPVNHVSGPYTLFESDPP